MGFLDDLRGKSGKSGVLADERLAPTDDGDHERFSHYVDKNKITESAVTGMGGFRTNRLLICSL